MAFLIGWEIWYVSCTYMNKWTYIYITYKYSLYVCQSANMHEQILSGIPTQHYWKWHQRQDLKNLTFSSNRTFASTTPQFSSILSQSNNEGSKDVKLRISKHKVKYVLPFISKISWPTTHTNSDDKDPENLKLVNLNSLVKERN